MLPACFVCHTKWHKQLREESVVSRKNQLVGEANVNPVYTCVITPSVSCERDMQSLWVSSSRGERESVLLMLFCGVSCYLSSLGTGVFSSCQPQRATMPQRPVGRWCEEWRGGENIHHLKISLTDCGQDVMDAAEECHGTVDCFVCCKTSDR